MDCCTERTGDSFSSNVMVSLLLAPMFVVVNDYFVFAVTFRTLGVAVCSLAEWFVGVVHDLIRFVEGSVAALPRQRTRCWIFGR